MTSPTMRRYPFLCAVITLISIASLINAQTANGQISSPAGTVPTMVKFSGTVQGMPSRIIGMTFALYKEQQGGPALWLETQSVSLDASGRYSVQLGATLPSGLPKELFTSGEARWLGVQAEGQPEQPRVLLLSVPYALKAADAETVGGLPASAFVLATPAASLSATAAPSGATSGTSAPIAPPTLGGSGTTGFVPLWTDGTDLGNSILFQTGTGTAVKLGVNTTTPTATLDVKGGSTVRGTLTLPAQGIATAAKGSNSQSISLVGAAFNSGTTKSVNQTFAWQTQPVGNNTSTPSGALSLLFASGTGVLANTGLSIASNGRMTFATGQTFPGTGTISGVTAGSGLTGGGTTGSVTLNLDLTKVPELNVANTFVGNQTVTGNVSATGVVTGNSFQIGSNLFGYGSFANSNAFLGFGGSTIATGTSNTSTGAFAMNQDTTGSQNTAMGASALLSNTTGSSNTAIGNAALTLNSTGTNNTATGVVSLQANITGSYNTANGVFSLSNNTTGMFNTAVGYSSGPDSAHPALNNSTAIGAMATVTASNSMVLGSISGVNGAGSSTNVGIGTPAPLFTLDVHGTGNFTGPVTFSAGQTFPNTISGVTAGTGMTGGGSSGNVTLNLDTTKIPQLNVANTFTGNQTVSGNVSATGSVTGSSFQIGSNLFAFGSYANFNAFIGFSGNTTTTGTSNTANGYSALGANTTGIGNTATGLVALSANTTGQFNTGDGLQALFFNTTGTNNTATGAGSLPHNTIGSYNTVSGEGTMYDNTSGSNNTAVGGGALFYNVTGSNNSAFGYGAGVGSSNSNLTNASAIGANAEVDESNAIVLGSINGVNFANANTNVGIGTTAPAFTLDVHGTGNFTGPITFASGQTFPGAGTIFGVTAGTGMTGGGTSGNVTLSVDTTKVVTGITAGTGLTGGGTGGVQTLNLDTTKVPQLNAANTFTGNQTTNGSLTATGAVSASSYQIGSSLFAFGSLAATNSFLGFAGNSTSSNVDNVGVGPFALAANTNGGVNTAIGVAALESNTIGGSNTAIGFGALNLNTAGSWNTAMGVTSLSGNTGDFNAGFGADALAGNTSGGQNTAVGDSALFFNKTGSNNTALGYNAGPPTGNTNLSNSTAIGALANVSVSNALVLGSINGVNTATASTNVGIGTTAPASTLDVESNAAGLVAPIFLLKNNAAVQSGTFGNSVDFRFALDGGSSVGNPNAYIRAAEDGNSQYGSFMSFATMADGGSGSGALERMRIAANGFVGVGVTFPVHIFQVGQGLGAAFADSWTTYSSRRWKTNIRTLPNALSKVEQLRGVSYDLRGSGKHEIGVIAEEVGQVVPEVVSFEANGKDAQGVDYSRLTAVLIEAVKEQQRQIQDQHRQIRLQQGQISRLNSKVGVLETALRTPKSAKASAPHSSKMETESKFLAVK